MAAGNGARDDGGRVLRLAALLTTYTIGTRAVAATAALLTTFALAAIAHAVLLVYQKQNRGGASVSNNLDFRQQGLKAAFIGDDGRASTSKTGIVVWTASRHRYDPADFGWTYAGLDSEFRDYIERYRIETADAA